MNHKAVPVGYVAATILFCVCALGVSASWAADEPKVRVAASERYEAGRVHRFALGGGYRDLWEKEIELPLLDPVTFEGGLKPIGRFGGLQTAVLGFVSADGRSFTFRGSDKDPSAVLPEDLQGTLIQSLVQDMMAAQHPAGAVVVSPISEAAGLLTIHERMVVLKDSPALGEYREEFAGMVGAFYEFPQPAQGSQPGFHDATEIIDHEELYAKLEQDYQTEVAVDAFLRARIFDILIGDFDRHRKQWRWAKLPGDSRWHPIPEDRDMAFVRYEGAAPRTAYLYVPILQKYGPEFPWIKGLTLHGWEQDRWLLTGLSWEDWEATARDVQSRVTDEVIDEGIAALPVEYQELDAERLRRDLRGRRDLLVEGARAFYEHLAGQVNFQGRDVAEAVSITRHPDGSTRVEVREQSGGPDASPVWSRTFYPRETGDVRLYLRGGDDKVTVTGGGGGPLIRVVAGSPSVAASEGAKSVDDSQGGDLVVYDEHGVVEVVEGPGTNVDARHWEEPPPQPGFVEVSDVPARDWGWDLIPIPQIGYEKDVGAFLGGGAVLTKFGFRSQPWQQKHRLTAGFATAETTGRVQYNGQFRFENSNLLATFDTGFSGIDVLRFYGFGNGTDDDANDGNFRAKTQVVRVAPGLRITDSENQLRLTGGPWMKWTRTKDNNGRLIAQEAPYGDGKFGMIGAFANIQFDTRKSVTSKDASLEFPLHDPVAAGYPTSGVFFDMTAEVSPDAWDVDEGTWGAIEGSISAYKSFFERDRVTFAARFGGRETFGDVPYFESAAIGGGRFFQGGAQVRGLRADRFQGNSSMYTNFDTRIFLARLKIVVPSDVGVHGFFDAGRVWGGEGQNTPTLNNQDNTSSEWHTGVGGGVWIAPLSRTNAISLTVAKSDEETLLYMHLGFQF